MDVSELSLTDSVEKMDVDKDLTNKFLSGEMSFSQYSSEWYSGEEDEDEDEPEESKKYEEEAEMSTTVSKRGLKRQSKFRRLFPALSGLMGEANIRLARGDSEMAERMCHEIIKQQPTAAEPYQTLAQIYEHDPNKSLQFSLLAAHLSFTDKSEWWRLAALCRQRSDYKQEMVCYTQAIKSEPQNLETHLKRLELLSELEKLPDFPVNSLKVSKVKCYHKIVRSLGPSDAETIMKYAKMAATLYHNSTEVEQAVEVMGIAYKKCFSLFTLEDINMYLELLITQKQFTKCIEVFVSSIGVEIEAEIQTVKNANGDIEEQTHYLNCVIPNNLAIDLKSKLLVCFIHLGALNLVQSLLNDFLSSDVEKAGDLYMDIEEAFSAVGHYEMAIKLLEPLIKNTSFDLGAVWLKYADCLNKLGRHDDAIESYYKVLKHVPQHADARRKLFTILENKGRIDDALNILQQDYKFVVSAHLLFDHCQYLKKYNRMLKYLEVGEALLSRDLTKFRHPEELRIACRTKGVVELIYNFRSMRGESPYHKDDLQFEEESFSLLPSEEFSMFKELLSIAKEHKIYSVSQRLTFMGMISKGLSHYRPEMEFYCFQACLLNRDFPNACRFVKDFSLKYSGPRSFNLLSFILNSLDENTHGKFLSRLFQKDFNIVKNLFLGNNFLVSGRYLVALKSFLEYYEQCREPLSALLIAVTILAMAAQRTVDRHHNLILQGLSYMLSYKHLRKCDQESYYNIGRAYQMLSINNLAIEYYERALACPPLAQCEEHGVIDLTKETAYNLYILYKDQSPELARRYMFKVLFEMNTAGVITPADDVLFGDLCSLLEQLQKKKKHRPEQNKLLSNFVDQFRLNLANTQGSKNSTFFPILRLLLPSCDRERGPYNLKETRLSTLLVKVLSLNKESTDAKQLIHFSSSNNSVLDSDFPGVAFYVIKKRVGQNNSVLTVGEINEILNSVATVDNVHKTPLDDIFSYALKKLTAIEFKWLLRIILKDLKLSMSADRILGIFHPDAPEVFKNCSSILKVCEELEDGDTRPSELGVNLFYAVRPMLSERLDITHIHVLDKTKTYCMEEKFDGERFQMHMDNNVFEYFSRKGFKYSKNYGQSYDSGMLTPYLKDIFAPEARNFILDGEMMGWHKIDNYFGCKAMSYDVKKITENSSFRPCFCVFDILYYNDRPLIGSPDKGGLPLRERLKILDDLFIDKRGVIEHSKRKIIKESSEVVDAVNDAIDNQDEGIVVKDINSYYIANKRNAGWYKIKPEYTDDTMNDLDLVVVGADEATNKRQGRAKSFYVACRDSNDGDPVWICIGRVSNGLKHEEKERVCSLLERNWCMYRKKPPPACLRFGKDKPDFWILPEHSIVLQVRATELLSVGDSHVLRFPRVEDIRSDKPVDDVCTIHELRQLAVSKSPVSKLSTKRVNESQIDQNYIKTRKRGLSKTVQVAEKFRTKTIGDVQVISRALFGKKLCVLSDDEDCKKTELKRVIESHGGKHVENPGSDTWCCVVGTMTPRARRLIETQDLDIISTAWLRSLPATDDPCHLSPLDMLSIKPETKLKLSLDYDPFGDSYKDEIDEKTLKKLLEKMDSELPLYPTLKEKVCLDKQLFGANNPYSFLRNCFIHVIDNSLYETMASFFGAKICCLDDVRLTHVVMSKDANVKIDKGILVSDGWLEECFNKRSFVPVDDYLI